MRIAILILLAGAALPAQSASPASPIVWTAKQLAEREQKAKAAVDPALHRGVERLMDSATLIYRDGPSEAEAHTDRADFINVRDGRGTILIGGTMIDGKPTDPGEIRGKAIQGGTSYPVAAGDSLYIPIDLPHQFLIDAGQHLVVTIVKVVPRR